MSVNDLQTHILKFTRLFNRTVNSIPRENYQLGSSIAAHLGRKIIKKDERDKSVSCVTHTNKQANKAAWLALDCAALPQRAKQIHFDANLSLGVWWPGWCAPRCTAFQHVARNPWPLLIVLLSLLINCGSASRESRRLVFCVPDCNFCSRIIIKAVAAAVASYKIYIRAAFLISSLVCATLSLRRNDGGARSFSADEPAAAFLMAAPAFNYSGGIRKLFARPPGQDEDERHTQFCSAAIASTRHAAFLIESLVVHSLCAPR